MAYSLPNTMAPDVSMGRGLDRGINFYNNLISQALEQAKNKRANEYQPYQIKHLLSQIENAKSMNARQQSLLNPRLQALKDAHERAQRLADPDYEVKKLMHGMELLKNFGQNAGARPTGEPGEQPQKYDALKNMLQGQGMFQGQGAMQAPEEQGVEQQPMGGLAEPAPQPEQQGFDINNLNPAQQAWLQTQGKKTGFNFGAMGKEAPETKRAAELKNKMELEKYKHEQRQAEEQQKDLLKNKATRQKAIESAKADIPHLETTLLSLEKMRDIAKDKKNSDMFGHTFLGFDTGERYARTAINPNVGAWQTYGLDPIVAAEQKMSSKGNQLALKTSLAMKPNFTETQQVALRKIEAAIGNIKHTIKQNRELINTGSNLAPTVKVYYNGKAYPIPKSEVAAALEAGGSLNG